MGPVGSSMLQVGQVRIELGPFLDRGIRKKGPRRQDVLQIRYIESSNGEKTSLTVQFAASLRRTRKSRRRRWTLVALAYITERNEGGEEEREREREGERAVTQRKASPVACA